MTPTQPTQPPRRPSRSGNPTSRPRRVAGQPLSPAAPTTPDTPEVVTPETDPPEIAEPAYVEPAPEPAPEPEPQAGPQAEPEPESGGGMAAVFEGHRPTRILTGVIAGLVVVLAVLVGLQVLGGDDDPAQGRRIPEGEIAVPADRPVLLSATDAQKAAAAAAEAASTIVATSYEDYDAQVDEATDLMTPEFATTFEATARDIEEAFVAAKTEVEVRIVAQSVVRANTTQVQALLFLNQYVTKDGQDTTYTPYRALVTVVNTDRGWLVSDIDTR